MEMETLKKRITDAVPNLRFSEFTIDKQYNNYRKYSFEDIFIFSTGKNIKQREASPEFEIPCVRYGELYHMYGEVIYEVINKTNLPSNELLFSKGDEILLPSAGEDPLDIGSASALPFENIAIGRTINVLRPKFSLLYSPIFVSFYINQHLKKKISSLAKGVSISNVYNSDLKKLNIILPHLVEQQKIATFLSAVDKKIQQLTRKKELLETYKKGVMQQLFSREIRFKDKDGKDFPEWEEKELGEVLQYLQPTKYIVKNTEYDNSYPTPVLTAGKTFLLGFTKETRNIYNENFPVIIFDDFTTAIQFVNFPFKVKSSAMKILIANGKVNMKFIYEAMLQIRFEIGGHSRHWISKYSFLTIPFPCIQEQQKIADFLSAIDRKTETVQQQITKTQSFKKGLLQQMFV